MGVDTMQHLHQKMVLLKRSALRSSRSEEVKALAAESAAKLWNAAADSTLNAHSTILAATKSLKATNQARSLDHLLSLDTQGAITRSVLEGSTPKEIKAWSAAVENMSTCIFSLPPGPSNQLSPLLMEEGFLSHVPPLQERPPSNQ